MEYLEYTSKREYRRAKRAAWNALFNNFSFFGAFRIALQFRKLNKMRAKLAIPQAGKVHVSYTRRHT